MAFPPSVYGDRAAAALNVMAEIYKKTEYSGMDKTYYSMTQPEGTLFEADLLLSCNNVQGNAVNYIMGIIDPDNECTYSSHLCTPFVPDQTQYDAMREEYRTTRDRYTEETIRTNIKKLVVNSVLEIRKSVRDMVGPEEVSPTPAFSDHLFGHHVAKVMNGLLNVEIQLTENDTTLPRPNGNDQQQVFKSLIQSSSLEEQRRSIALRSGKGTAFAGDFLVLQHFRSRCHEIMDKDGQAVPLVKGALFPAFEHDITLSKQCTDVLTAITHVREEIDFVNRIIHGQVLPFLMGSGPRLGRESPFLAMDREIMCIIGRMVIFGKC